MVLLFYVWAGAGWAWKPVIGEGVTLQRGEEIGVEMAWLGHRGWEAGLLSPGGARG